jgi:hypothetical protein
MSNIHKALATALGEIHRLKKDDKNQHGGYAYVSVDDVKDHVRPILSKHGLFLQVTEESFEMVQVQGKSGSTSSALIRYAIALRHASGEGMEPDLITICLPYTGAQTAGAARSYAVKEWAKGSLLVSTGEKDAISGGADADAYKQQEYVAPREERPTAHAARQNGGDEAFKKIQNGLRQIEREGSLEDLALFWKNSQAAMKKMPAGWVSELSKQKDELKSAFEKAGTKPLHAPSTDDQSTEEHDPETGEIIPGITHDDTMTNN